jgi:hypothetical protein
MPNHIHLIIEVESADDLSIFLRDFKKFTSREIKKRCAEIIERVWQPGTMDHCIRMSWSGNDYQNHISYLFYNSYKHLGIIPKNYPYHNFRSFVLCGYFDEGFFDFDEEVHAEFKKYE